MVAIPDSKKQKILAIVSKELEGHPTPDIAKASLEYVASVLDKLSYKSKSKIPSESDILKDIDYPRKLTDKQIDEVLSVLRLWVDMRNEPARVALENHRKILREELVKTWVCPSLFSELKAYIQKKFDTAQIQPGEMVGVLLAHAMGEPSTQLTLNTFHLAGVGNAYVNTGIKRIVSLLAVSRNDPSARIFFLKKYEPVELFRKIKDIKAIRIYELLDIGDASRVYLQVLPRPEYEPWWYSMTGSLPEGEFNHYIHLKFSAQKLYRYGLTMINVENILMSEYCNSLGCDAKLIIKRSPETYFEMHIYLESFTWKDEKEKDNLFHEQIHVNEDNVIYYFMRDKLADIIKNVRVCGIDEIEDVTIARAGDEWVIDTKGCNLTKIFANPEVDHTRTCSSVVMENFEMLGIEAARQYIYDAFKYVFEANGVLVAPQVLWLLVDSMTESGIPLSVSRYSMGTRNVGVFQKATFEKTDESFTEAAFSGQVDTCNGVSANILIGNPIRGGTGMPVLITDKLKEEELLSEIREYLGVKTNEEINGAIVKLRGGQDSIDIVEYDV